MTIESMAGVMHQIVTAIRRVADEHGSVAFGASWEHHARTQTSLHNAAEMLVLLCAVAEKASALTEAADACDREAERPLPSQSSAPAVRQIRAMTELREALRALENA